MSILSNDFANAGYGCEFDCWKEWPAGTTSVYDEVMGESVVLPFLHVKYRKTATEDRKYKSWVVGSAGGASNSDIDAMSVHFLSERALCVMGANNFILLK